jgi:hypothetical protein
MTDTGRNIVWAVGMMQKGGKVWRTSWNGNARLELIPAEHPNITEVAMTAGRPSDAVLWVPSVDDLIATDWELAGE